MDKRVQETLERALAGQQPTREEAIYLLGFAEHSPEATYIRGVGNDVARARTGNTALIFGQIGLELYPCEADCQFCSFGETHTGFTEKITLDEETIREKVRAFTKDGDLYVLWLMTMNSFDLDYFSNALKIAREIAPPQTKLYTNIGDVSYETFVKLKEAGADGVYHVVRLGEGNYTTISPERRLETRDNAVRAGLALQDCIEPIGPEHSSAELVERMFKTQADGIDTAGVMKRTPVPGTIFTTAITNLRMAQITAVNALVMIPSDPYPWIPIHEAEPLGLVSGGNSICAETGVNPRDTAADTSTSRGLDVSACRKMLWEAGFTQLAKGDGTRIPLTADYITERDAADDAEAEAAIQGKPTTGFSH
jgi:biotin synthase